MNVVSELRRGRHSNGPSTHLRTLIGTSRSDEFAVGDHGSVLRFTGHLPAPVEPE